MLQCQHWLGLAAALALVLAQDDQCDVDDCAGGQFFGRRVKREFAPYRTGKSVAAEVSNALDQLLLRSGYDKRIRPNVGGPPIPVVINLSIRSMGPVDENREVFSLDCYFRQSWVDPRLRFNSTAGITELALNWAFLAKIWVPDTVFINGKKSYLHKITVPNRFVRISPTGRVSYSQRLTLWARCPMDLSKFPFDTPVCRLHVGSFGYDANDVLYRWAAPTAVSVDELGLAQYHLIDYGSFEKIFVGKRRTKLAFRNDSVASLEFVFERQTGFFLLQIYTPLSLIVCCSFVAFWLVRTGNSSEVQPRVNLGATSVLAVVNIGFGGKSRPLVGYATALDIFIVLCLITVFASLLETACINFIDQFMKALKARDEEREAKLRERLAKKEAVVVALPLAAATIGDATATVDVNEIKAAPPIFVIGDDDDDEDFEDIDEQEEKKTWLARFYDGCVKCVYSNLERAIVSRWGPVAQLHVYRNTEVVIYDIDAYSRKLFPLAFILIQIGYWVCYLFYM